MKFSDRVGVTKPEDVVQVNSINEDLRTSLWNVLTACYWDKFDKNKYDGSGYGGRLDYISASNLSGLFNHLWLSYFKKPIDKMPLYFFDSDGGLSVLRDYFFGSEWYEVYNFLEFICDFGPSDFRSKFVKTSNFILEREKSGYRFVDGKLIEISSVEEVAEIVNAIENYWFTIVVMPKKEA